MNVPPDCLIEWVIFLLHVLDLTVSYTVPGIRYLIYFFRCFLSPFRKNASIVKKNKHTSKTPKKLSDYKVERQIMSE